MLPSPHLSLTPWARGLLWMVVFPQRPWRGKARFLHPLLFSLLLICFPCPLSRSPLQPSSVQPPLSLPSSPVFPFPSLLSLLMVSGGVLLALGDSPAVPLHFQAGRWWLVCRSWLSSEWIFPPAPLPCPRPPQSYLRTSS